MREHGEELVLGFIGRLQFGARRLVLVDDHQQVGLALRKRLLGTSHIGLVAQDLHKTDNRAAELVHGHHHTAVPQLRAIPQYMETVVAGAAFDKGLARFAGAHVRLTVFDRKNHVRHLADRLMLRVAEDALGA